MCCGCGGSSESSTEDWQEFRNLTILYCDVVKHTASPPVSEQAFKAHLQSVGGQAVAKALEVANVEELFISKRDGKPIVLIYGQRPPGVRSDVGLYEQEGVNGKRLVGYTLGMVEEVDEAKFRELVPAGAAAK